jgi:hypothetical protein
MSRELLESAVRKLGPIAAANALTAFQTGERANWDSCVLARAYGADGELGRDAMARECGSFQMACKTFGLTVDEASWVVHAFDLAPEQPNRHLLRSLLEQEASKIAQPVTRDELRSEATPPDLYIRCCECSNEEELGEADCGAVPCGTEHIAGTVR